MHELSYFRPTTVPEATALLALDGARALAGGTDLIPQVREGRRPCAAMIDLKHIPELGRIERLPDGSWMIGAALSIGRLGRHAELAREHGPLLDSARLVGSLQIQNRATIAGNLCNAAPSADAVPLLMALGAEVELAGPGGRRRVPADAVPIGPGRSSIAAGEIITAIILPPKAKRSAARYLRFTPRREMDIAIAGAGVSIDIGPDQRISSARIVLASVAPTPLPVGEAARLLVGEMPSVAAFAAAGAKAAQEARPISDTRGSADYRRELVAVLTRRALTDCAGQLGILLK